MRFDEARDELQKEFIDFATAERITGKDLATLILSHI